MKGKSRINCGSYFLKAAFRTASVPFMLPNFVRRMATGQTTLHEHERLAREQPRGTFHYDGPEAIALIEGTVAGIVADIAVATTILLTSTPTDDYLTKATLIGTNAVSLIYETLIRPSLGIGKGKLEEITKKTN